MDGLGDAEGVEAVHQQLEALLFVGLSVVGATALAPLLDDLLRYPATFSNEISGTCARLVRSVDSPCPRYVLANKIEPRAEYACSA